MERQNNTLSIFHSCCHSQTYVIRRYFSQNFGMSALDLLLGLSTLILFLDLISCFIFCSALFVVFHLPLTLLNPK